MFAMKARARNKFSCFLVMLTKQKQPHIGRAFNLKTVFRGSAVLIFDHLRCWSSLCMAYSAIIAFSRKNSWSATKKQYINWGFMGKTLKSLYYLQRLWYQQTRTLAITKQHHFIELFILHATQYLCGLTKAIPLLYKLVLKNPVSIQAIFRSCKQHFMVYIL